MLGRKTFFGRWREKEAVEVVELRVDIEKQSAAPQKPKSKILRGLDGGQQQQTHRENAQIAHQL
jgi:hypothetical protein